MTSFNKTQLQVKGHKSLSVVAVALNRGVSIKEEVVYLNYG